MPELIDAIDALVRYAKPGMATFGRTKIDNGPWETHWFLREESERIAHLGPHPFVGFSAGGIEMGNVFILPVFVLVGLEEPENVWETYINAHNESGEQAIDDLTTQERLVVHFIGDSGQRERSIRVDNQLKKFATQVQGELLRYTPWTMHEFDISKESLYERFPTGFDLWKALNK